MAEKLFVIMEVVKREGADVTSDGCYQYLPMEITPGRKEFFWLHPERAIPASRLRYGVASAPETCFDPQRGWMPAALSPTRTCLILDPPASVDEWDAWVESGPFTPGMIIPEPINALWFNEFMKAIILWLRRMPRRNP